VLHALRLVIGAVGAVMLAAGLLLLAAGGVLAWSGIQLLVLGALGVGIALFEQTRYWPGRATTDRGRLQPTDERFIDPSSGERTRVWIDPASGERSYLPDGERPDEG
jgi:membrane protein DedA with SNARE-associated domain